jgi:hypothetical protein
MESREPTERTEPTEPTEPTKPPKKLHVLTQWFNKTLLGLVITDLFAVLLVTPEWNVFAAIIGMHIMYFWVYATHMILHWLYNNDILNWMNTHLMYHHQYKDCKFLDRRTELFFEFFTDMGMCLSPLLIQYVTGVWLIPPSIVLFYGFTYTSIHTINYSIYGTETHRRHHKDPTKNFGADAMDHLFGTNYDETMEDIMPFTFNAMFAAAAVYMLKQYIGWKD